MGLKVAFTGRLFNEADIAEAWHRRREFERLRIQYGYQTNPVDQTFVLLVADSVCLASDVYP